MADEKTRRLILARRARFVAAALAGAAATTEACSSPEPCLSIAQDNPTPEPAPPFARDGAVVADAALRPSDADADSEAEDASPRPCLSIAPDAGGDQ